MIKFCIMNSKHRLVIKENRIFLKENIDFNKLYRHLVEYKIFNKYMWEDIHSISDVLELLPTRGPEAFHNFIEILRKVDYNPEANYLESRSQNSQVDSPEKLFYKMSTEPLGYCLIINNMKFVDGKLEYRAGSNVDAISLQNFFERADFNVEIESNLTSEQMLQCLKDFSKRDFSKVDSMILIIMSHGGHLNNKEFVYGTNGKVCPPGGFLYKDDIFKVFSNKNCDVLQLKPKIFFFVACRGESKDYGVSKIQPKESLDSVISDIVLPEFSDMLVINSSLPNNVTVRDHERGTYFCQALVDVLNEWYKIHDLETMIKLVNQKLEGKVSEIYRIVQAVHVETTVWKRKIMLCHKN